MADEIFSSLGLSFKPSDGIGRQFSQSLAFFDETAFSLAISYGELDAATKSLSNVA